MIWVIFDWKRKRTRHLILEHEGNWPQLWTSNTKLKRWPAATALPSALFSLPVDEERSRLDRTRTVHALRHTAQLFLKTPNIDQTFCSLSVEVAMPQEPCPLPTVKAPTHKRAAENTQHRPQGLPAQGPLCDSSVMREGQFQLVQWLL